MDGKYQESLPNGESHKGLCLPHAVGNLDLKAETKPLGSRAESCQLLGFSHRKLSLDGLRDGPPWLTQPF